VCGLERSSLGGGKRARLIGDAGLIDGGDEQIVMLVRHA
jgi:hypothetical protein